MKRLLDNLKNAWMRLRGFTLLEILLVVTILTIIVAMAIPTLRNTKRSSYEMGAAKALKTLGEAELAYQNVFHHYTDFEGLRQLGFINRDWRKYNPTGDIDRMAKHYSIDYKVRNTYRWFTFGWEFVAYPDPNLTMDALRIQEDGTIEVLRQGRWRPR